MGIYTWSNMLNKGISICNLIIIGGIHHFSTLNTSKNLNILQSFHGACSDLSQLQSIHTVVCYNKKIWIDSENLNLKVRHCNEMH